MSAPPSAASAATSTSGSSGPQVIDHGPSLDLANSDALLRRLELTVRNKLDGLLQGNYLGLLPGPGSEVSESRLYVPGDDVRRMDWAVTARTTVPHVRQTVADRELETWLVVDLSPSLDVGTARSEKRELVFAAITAAVYMTVRGGNRVGAVVTTGEQTFRIPAESGIAHARHLIDKVAAAPRAEQGRRGDLAQALEMVRRPPRRRGLIAVVSDFLGDEEWVRPLRGLGERHQLLGVEILDPAEVELADAGLVTFLDPESGEQLEVQTSKPAVRARYAAAAAEQRRHIATMLRHAGAAHLQLRTDRDWLDDVLRFVIAQRRMIGGGSV